jgi:hypothetical protein
MSGEQTDKGVGPAGVDAHHRHGAVPVWSMVRSVAAPLLYRE